MRRSTEITPARFRGGRELRFKVTLSFGPEDEKLVTDYVARHNGARAAWQRGLSRSEVLYSALMQLIRKDAGRSSR